MHSLPTHAARSLVVAAIALTTLLPASLPAAATVHPFSGSMDRGVVVLGIVELTTPSNVPCGESTGIGTSVNDAASPSNVNNMTASLAMSTYFVAPLFGGLYKLEASGTGSGGDYNVSTDEFSDLTFSTVSFTVRSANDETCAVGSTVCSGTFNLVFSGETDGLPSTEAYVNASGVFAELTSCSFPFTVFIGAEIDTVLIHAHPDYPSDPGAHFT